MIHVADGDRRVDRLDQNNKGIAVIAQIIGVFVLVVSQGVAAGKRIVSDKGHPVGDADARERAAIVECGSADTNQAFGKDDVCERAAISERGTSDAFRIISQRYVGEGSLAIDDPFVDVTDAVFDLYDLFASGKSIASDVCHTVRDGDVRKRNASIERIASDARQAFGEGDFRERRALIEGFASDARHAFRQRDFRE